MNGDTQAQNHRFTIQVNDNDSLNLHNAYTAIDMLTATLFALNSAGRQLATQDPDSAYQAVVDALRSAISNVVSLLSASEYVKTEDVMGSLLDGDGARETIERLTQEGVDNLALSIAASILDSADAGDEDAVFIRRLVQVGNSGEHNRGTAFDMVTCVVHNVYGIPQTLAVRTAKTLFREI